MEEYRDLRHSVPGWCFIISIIAVLFDSNVLKISQITETDNIAIILAAGIALLITSPAISFFINTVSYMIIIKFSKNFWGHFVKEPGYSESQLEFWVKSRLQSSDNSKEANKTGFPDSLHTTLSRRWSYVMTCIHSTTGILSGLAIGKVIAISNKPTMFFDLLWPYPVFIIVAIIFFKYALIIREQVIKMEKIFIDLQKATVEQMEKPTENQR